MPKKAKGGHLHEAAVKLAKKQGSLRDAAVKLGGEGGKHGGPARAKALTPSKRTAIARQGGKARQQAKER